MDNPAIIIEKNMTCFSTITPSEDTPKSGDVSFIKANKKVAPMDICKKIVGMTNVNSAFPTIIISSNKKSAHWVCVVTHLFGGFAFNKPVLRISNAIAR
jgi:hypothetical protein